MKKLTIAGIIAFGLFLTNCGESKPKELSFQEQLEQAEKESEANTLADDLQNKGIGPISDFTFSEKIDSELAEKGKTLYNEKCVACHKTNERYLGPAPEGILERRHPAWVLNMILNPEEMIEKDPIAIRLMEEYKTPMLNQNLTKEEAIAVLEYFRTL